MTEISFRHQSAEQIVQQMAGKRLEGAVAALTETTLVNLLKIAKRRGYTGQRTPDFDIYHQGSGHFDARFCCEPADSREQEA